MLKEKLLIYSLTLFICALPKAGVEALGQETPLTVNIASLAEKSMGEIIQTLGKPRYCWEFELKKMKTRITPGTPYFDDACVFRIGWDHFTAYSWKGHAVAFMYSFGNNRKRSTKPEEALRRLGIDVRDVKSSQILKNPSERPFTNIQDPPIPKPIMGRLLRLQDVIWSGNFNEKKWKELRVCQSEDDNRCYKVIAILDYNAQ
ncbi:MAG: hypothetical protein MOB07_24975 [Acidobacteria bacterium]|nr:hypothetical protein [Acidobacteriota bacterium]